MLRGFVLLALLGVAGFLGYKLWITQQWIDEIKAEAENPPARMEITQTSPDAPQNEASRNRPTAPARDLEVAARNKAAQQATLDGIANHVAGKGATVLDKRVFDSLEACSEAVAIVVREYRRRGVVDSNIIDSSALLDDIPGATMTSINNVDHYLYLTCYPHPQNRWAGYIQFSMTPEQVRASNEERALQGR